MSRRLTLKEQIQKNKRGSAVFVTLMVVLLAALTTCVVGFAAPKHWYWGTAGGLGLGLLAGLIARYMGSKIILSISHAREATDMEHRRLKNVVEEMAIAGGVPVPKIYVIDDSAPNAFATGGDPQNGIVAITTGLMEKLDRDELQGVMAHEIAHIRNYDIRYMTTVSILAGMIAMVADLFREMSWRGARRRSSDRDENNLGLIFLVVGLVLSIVAPLAAILLQMAVSRKREFLADATAAQMTRYPEGLARALQKISHDQEHLESANRATQHMYIINPLKLGGGGSDLFSTHPDTDERIRALMGLAGNYQTERKLGLAPKPLND